MANLYQTARKEILKQAEETICKDRQDQYGNAENSFSDIASLWTDYLDVDITSFDVAMMMVLLKIARAKANPRHMDNYIDMCGYAALGAEMADILKYYDPEPKDELDEDDLKRIEKIQGELDDIKENIKESLKDSSLLENVRKAGELVKKALTDDVDDSPAETLITVSSAPTVPTEYASILDDYFRHSIFPDLQERYPDKEFALYERSSDQSLTVHVYDHKEGTEHVYDLKEFADNFFPKDYRYENFKNILGVGADY